MADATARQRILVVDDESQVRTLITKVLSRAGYHVYAAADIDQAAEILDGPDELDLLLTDVQMSGARSGFELADTAKTARPSLHVLYCSGHLAPERDHKGPVHGAVLSKPFGVTELLAAVKDSLR